MKLGLSIFFSAVLLLSQRTDTATVTIPSAPSLPAAGGTFVDPVFGTTIMRVTSSATDATACWHDYSYWAVFNKDNTRLIVQCTGGRYWYDFNPVTFTLGTKTAWPDTPTPVTVSGDGSSQWSGLDPVKAWVLEPYLKKIWSVNVTTGTYTAEKTFSAGEMPASTHYLVGMTISQDDDVFEFDARDIGDNDTGCFWWRKSNNTVLYTKTTTNLDECQVDRAGLWGSYKPATDPGGGKWTDVINLTTQTVVSMNESSSAWAFHHSDMGRGFATGLNGKYPDGVGGGSDGGARLYHNFLTLGSYIQVTPGTSSDGHMSCGTDDDETCLQSWYRIPKVGGQFHEELWSTYNDGSRRTIRYAHHQSDATSNYRAQPQANISRDGQFVTYNSNNMSAAGRTDVFVVKVKRQASSPIGVGVSF